MPAMPVLQPLFLVLGAPRPELRVSGETGPETMHRYHTRECQMEELKQGRRGGVREGLVLLCAMG